MAVEIVQVGQGDHPKQPQRSKQQQQLRDPQEFTFSDFEDCSVFAYLYGIENKFSQAMEENRMAARAQAVGFKNFKRLFAQYRQAEDDKKKQIIQTNGVSNFADVAFDLNTGEWMADELGVFRQKGGQLDVACSHPIFPARRLRSIDTSLIKYELKFKRGGETARSNWTPVILDASEMSSPTDIVKKLAPYGVSVTGGSRANALVDYLRDMCDLNYDIIPEVKCVSRMGWNEEGFAPYNGDAEYDGAAAFLGAFNAIRCQGNFEQWMFEAKDARSYSLTARIVLAASFAAPLVEPLGISPFFVHLWSTASGTGKSVGQMLAASVWADPTPGGAFFPTFRSTSVGFEMMAGFLHSLPLIIDELQLAKDHHGKVNFNVYELASGSGKLRSNKSLGLNYTPKWSMVFITSGETPIVSELDGEGALNRVFEIECFANDQVIKDGHRTANVLRDNFGFAGRKFIDCLQRDGAVEKARALYDRFFQSCCAAETTEKQAMAAAAILTADALATEWIFQDGNELTVNDIAEYLKSKERVSLMQRGYDSLCDWVAINNNKLRGLQDGDKGECYGIVRDGVACIIRSAFNKFCSDNGINAAGFLSHLRTKKLLQLSTRGFTKVVAIGKDESGRKLAHCVCIILPNDDGNDGTMVVQGFNEISGEDDELPF